MKRGKINIRQFWFVVCLCAAGGVIVACGPSAGELEFRSEIAKTKQSVRIADIRAAVVPLYAKYFNPAGHEMIPYDEIPKIISSLPFFGYSRFFVANTDEQRGGI